MPHLKTTSGGSNPGNPKEKTKVKVVRKIQEAFEEAREERGGRAPATTAGQLKLLKEFIVGRPTGKKKKRSLLTGTQK